MNDDNDCDDKDDIEANFTTVPVYTGRCILPRKKKTTTTTTRRVHVAGLTGQQHQGYWYMFLGRLFTYVFHI